MIQPATRRVPRVRDLSALHFQVIIGEMDVADCVALTRASLAQLPDALDASRGIAYGGSARFGFLPRGSSGRGPQRASPAEGCSGTQWSTCPRCSARRIFQSSACKGLAAHIVKLFCHLLAQTRFDGRSNHDTLCRSFAGSAQRDSVASPPTRAPRGLSRQTHCSERHRRSTTEAWSTGWRRRAADVARRS